MNSTLFRSHEDLWMVIHVCRTQREEWGQAGYCAVAWMHSHWSRKVKYCFKTQMNGPIYI